MKQARVLTQTEIKRLLKVVSTTKHAGRNRLIVMLSYLAGLRACEIAALRIGDVITELNDSWEVKNEVLLKSSQTKGSKAQTVVFSTQLMKEISDYYKTIRLVVDRTDHLIGSQKKQVSQVKQYKACFVSCMSLLGSLTQAATVVAGRS